VSWGAAETRRVSRKQGRQAGRNRESRFQEASQRRTINHALFPQSPWSDNSKAVPFAPTLDKSPRICSASAFE
jgi:hypothetical protein